MPSRQISRPLLVSVVLIACGCALPPLEDVGAGATDGFKQVFIDEQVFYTTPLGTCPDNTPLTPLGADTKKAFNDMTWAAVLGEDASDSCEMPGHRCAVPTDFVEFGELQPDGLLGKDHLWGDAATVSIFQGHGAHDVLDFRRPSETPTGDDVCRLRLSDRVRLGIGGGNRTRVAMFAASCVGYAADLLDPNDGDDFVDSLGASNAWQFLAFYDSPSLNNDMFPNFVGFLKEGRANYIAWIEATYLNPPNDYNQPIAYTTYNAAADAAQPFDYLGTRHESASLFTKAHLPPPAPTPFTGFTYTYSQDIDVWADPIPSDCEDNLSGN